MGAAVRVVVVALVLSAPRIARADEASAALAQSLFDEAVALMQQGKFPEACPKLRESMRLDPAGGTALDLAFCLEKEGRTASAYAAYKDAEHVASVDGRKDREATAKARATLLAATLPRMSVRVHDRAVSVQLDGALLGEAALTSPLPVDPGPHRLTARAPGRVEWSRSFEAAPGETTTVDVPALEPLAPPPTAPAPSSHAVKPWSTPSKVLLGSAGASLLVGLGFGAGALLTHGAAGCDGDVCPNARAVDLEQRADTFAWVSNVALATAVVAGAVGLLLHVTARNTTVAKW